MSSGGLIAIGVVVLVVLAIVLLVGASRRRDTGEAIGELSRETRRRDRGRGRRGGATSPAEPVASGRDVEKSAAIERREPATAVVRATPGEVQAWTPPDPETLGVSRRQFLNRGIVTLMSFSLTAFGLSVIGFLWPTGTGGFGGKVTVGSTTEIQSRIDQGKGFGYFAEARMWVTNYPASALEKARKVPAYTPPIYAGMEKGYVFLWQRCVHLGCRVPSCETSQWFECPCHGSQYNQVGEKKGGPTPRGLDHFTPTFAGEIVTVDTSQTGIVQGPPIGTNTTGQEAEGPHCVSGGGHGVTLALTNETIGWVIFVVITGGVVIYALINILRAGKRELGSELEVAANRKEYLPDDQLEGPKLDRTLTIALLTLVFIAIALPLYWILEPGRQANASADFNRKFVDRGAEMFAPTGTTPGGLNLNCAGCHGGMKATGGSAPYNLALPDGTIKVVSWRAPALNTVLLRFSREEVTYILTYGRPFSPMPAWGLNGGGPLNDQQIQNLIDYLESIQITPEQAQQEARDGLNTMMALKNPDGSPVYTSEGEALFNMGLGADVASGAFSCGRCHTQGWSYATNFSQVQAVSGCGALGPSMCGGSVDRQFPASDVPAICDNGSTPPADAATTTTSLPPCKNPYQDQIDFVTTGSDIGKKYGEHGQGTGRMPAFGQRQNEPGNETFQGSPGALFWIFKGKDRTFGPNSGMLPEDLIDKIVLYERSLP